MNRMFEMTVNGMTYHIPFTEVIQHIIEYENGDVTEAAWQIAQIADLEADGTVIYISDGTIKRIS